MGMCSAWPKQAWLLFLRALAPQRTFDTLQASALEVEPGDVLLLAHFSMVPALDVVKQSVSVPVLTSPHAAVEKLRACLA